MKFLRARSLWNTSGWPLLITFHWFILSTSRKRAPWKRHFFHILAGCIVANLLFHYRMFSSSVSQHKNENNWLIAVDNFCKKLHLVPLSWFWIRLYLSMEGFAHRQVVMLFYHLLATGYTDLNKVLYGWSSKKPKEGIKFSMKFSEITPQRGCNANQ